MKKTSIIVLVIASVMLLASCGGVNDFNTPKDVIGEWKGSTSEAVVTSTVDANYYAGTYTFETTIANSDYEDSTFDYDGSIFDGTYRTYNDPISNKITATRTIADDFSYTEEVKVVTTVSARNAIASSSTNSSSEAWTPATQTVTRTKTVTVTKNTDGSYIEKATTTYSIVADHDYFWEYDSRIDTTVSNTAQTVSYTSTAYKSSEDYLSYNSSIEGEYVYTSITPRYNYVYYPTYDRELVGYNLTRYYSQDASFYRLSRVAPTVTTTYTSQSDYNLVVGEDGTFTYTTTETLKYTAPEAKDVVVKNVYTGMATGSGDGYLTLNTKKAVYTVDADAAVTKEFSKYDTYDYYIVNKTLQINGMPTLTLVEPAK